MARRHGKRTALPTPPAPAIRAAPAWRKLRRPAWKADPRRKAPQPETLREEKTNLLPASGYTQSGSRQRSGKTAALDGSGGHVRLSEVTGSAALPAIVDDPRAPLLPISPVPGAFRAEMCATAPLGPPGGP